MASAMAGLIAQPSLQGIPQASLSSLNSSSISRQRVSCSLEFTSTSGFGKNPFISGKPYVSQLRASASSVPLGGDESSLGLGGGGNGAGLNGGGKSGGGGGGDSYGEGESEGGSPGGIFGTFWKGWNDRVRADPQFPFKVLMEEVVGVGACVLGDMACRPNFGLNELDFVFCTLVVGCIVNFMLMYMLAPTSAAGAVATHLPGIFASCPSGHMFEPGTYSLVERAGTFVYKGAQFAVVGFAAGLVGTAISNTLIAVRTKLDPDFVVQNEAPPTILNAATWALHMGLSSNSRYQSLNGLEFALASKMPPAVFKTGVLVVRALNNVLGGSSFVALARITGSQKTATPPIPPVIADAEEKLLESVDEVMDETFGKKV
ncbi:hypothetical protein M758_9G061500 [Ceratodon purpureus]|nr:hypothetical protein M758_9G061500 [Ceratodon purpureus]